MVTLLAGNVEEKIEKGRMSADRSGDDAGRGARCRLKPTRWRSGVSRLQPRQNRDHRQLLRVRALLREGQLSHRCIGGMDDD